MPQRISINGRFLTQAITGVQRYATELVKGLDGLLESGAIDRRDFEFELLVPPRPAARPIPLKHITQRCVGRTRGHLWEQLELPRFVSGGVLLCLSNAAPLASLIGRTTTVVTVHDLSYRYYPQAYAASYRLFYRILTPLIMRLANHVITVSGVERASIVATFPNVADRLTAIQNGNIEHPSWDAVCRRPPESDSTASSLVLYVGALSQRKNLQGVLDAVRRVKARFGGVRLGIVGGSSAAFGLAGFTIPPEIKEQVEFFGQIDSLETLGNLYARSRCLIFPSFYESSGLPPIEAMSYGCPAVVSDIPALRERCGDAALYCHPDNPDEIADRILEFLTNDATYEEFRRRGHEQAQQFSWSRCARETFAIIEGLSVSASRELAAPRAAEFDGA
jgi:glycosyltransferase involved in cell wall biosynthesis